MSKLRFELVTPERIVYADDDVDAVVVPGADGELGILPSHAPLLAALGIGELRVKKGTEEESFAVHGGYVEVLANKVIVMASAAERATEIDVARAEEARGRADRLLRDRPADLDMARLHASIARSRVRMKVARSKRRLPTPQREQDSG